MILIDFEYVSIKLKTGEELLIDKDDYLVVEPYDWRSRKTGNNGEMTVCRVDKPLIALKDILGYKGLRKLKLKLKFNNNNCFDYRKTNIELVRTDKPKESKKPRISKKELDQIKNTSMFYVPTNQCTIRKCKDRDIVCAHCRDSAEYTDFAYDRCLDVAAFFQWPGWVIETYGNICQTMKDDLEIKNSKKIQ